MFRKVLIAAMFATAAGYCFAAPQVVTSETFYSNERDVVETTTVQYDMPLVAKRAVPVWPLAGSDADVDVACESGACAKTGGAAQSDNIKIVSKIGADLVVENNFNLGPRGDFAGWSGGANMIHGSQVPFGFDDECANNAEMPLLGREMLEDDGGEILSVSRSGRKKCSRRTGGDEYTAFAMRNGMVATSTGPDGTVITEEQTTEFMVDPSADAEAPRELTDQVRSWVVANGQTLREILQNWCDKEGWDLVWTTSREYPVEASAVFKGRFVDVASALVRNFGRATPTPYAKFYNGNRVLVISTNEE